MHVLTNTNNCTAAHEHKEVGASATYLLPLSCLFLSVSENVMAFQPVPDVAQFVLRYTTVPGEFWGANVINMRYIAGSIDEAALETACTNFAINWPLYFDPLTSNQIVIQSVEARDLTEQMGVQGFAAIASVGTLTSPVLPGNVTFAVKFLTGAAGRSRRGRSFFIGLAENQVAGNFVSGAFATAVTAAWADFNAAMVADGWQLVVVSRQQNGVVLTEGIPYTVTSITVSDLQIDTQRRRLRASLDE